MRNKLVRIEIMATVVFKCDCCGHTNKQDVKVHCKSWGEPMDDNYTFYCSDCDYRNNVKIKE